MDANTKHREDDGYKYTKIAMSWHGWGSPVGLGIFLLCLGGFLYLLKLA